ncbi:MAG: hypothetical protein NT092_00855 [Bacteroidia bacterium]|nr:hypothetical protein [Bacteroidia bacterium]
MKRISKILFLFILTIIVPFSMASGQEKKTEKKVKVVIVDKDGTKTVVDTTFTGDSAPGSITLKNGKIIYFDSPGTVTTEISSEEGKGKIFVTTTIDDDGTKSKEEKVIVVTGEGGERTVTSSTGTRDEMTKYVIAKDGVVVTVESNDEAKAKEIIKVIENKLDVKK